MKAEPSRLAVQRAQEAQAVAGTLETLIYKRALQELVDLANTLHSVTSHAQAGDPAARKQLQNFVQKLDLARAVGAGLVLPDNGTPPAG